MAKESGLGDRLLVAGYDISGDITDVQVSGTTALGDVTDITQSAHSRLGLLRDGTMSATVLMDADLAHPVVSALPTSDIQVMYLRGDAQASPAACLNALEASYDGTRETGGMLTFKMQAQGDGYGLEWGIQLTDGIQTDTEATTGTAVDYGASSSDGAQFYLQVTAFTGTSVTVTVEESADNSSWTDLAAFTAVTAANTTQRITVTGDVDEYLRIVSSGTFTSATYVVAANVNQIATAF